MAFWGTAFLLLGSVLLLMLCIMALKKWCGKVVAGFAGAVFGIEMALLPFCILFAASGGDSSSSPFRGVSFDDPIRNIKFFIEAHAEFARTQIISGLRSGKNTEICTWVGFLAILLICGGLGFSLVYSLKNTFAALWASVGIGIAGDILYFLLFALVALGWYLINNVSGAVGIFIIILCFAALFGGGGGFVVFILKKE